MKSQDPIETKIMRMNDREMEARDKGFCFASGRKFGKTEEQKRTNARESLIRRYNLLCECGHLEKEHDLYDAVTRERMDCLVGVFKGMEINAQICPCNKFCLQGRFNMIKTTAQLQQRFVEISEDNSFPKNFGTGENLIGLPPNDIYQLGFAAAFFECSRAVNQYVDAQAEETMEDRDLVANPLTPETTDHFAARKAKLEIAEEIENHSYLALAGTHELCAWLDSLTKRLREEAK